MGVDCCSGSLHKLAPTVALTPGYEGHNYAVVAPVASESAWAFIGETDKYVTASRLRFHRLRFGSATDVAAGRAAALSVNVVGLAGEAVKVCKHIVKAIELRRGSGFL